MTDPVIVSSGQTYDRAYIQEWFDLGLDVCPKTRQPLELAPLVPNYIVKGFIDGWCLSNNVKLPVPIESRSLNQSARDSSSPIASSRSPIEKQSSTALTASKESLPEVTTKDGHGFAIENASFRGSDDSVDSSDEKNLNSGGNASLVIDNKDIEDQQTSQDPTRNVPHSSKVTDSESLHGLSREGNESSHGNCNDASDHVTSQSRETVNLNIQRIEAEHPHVADIRTRIPLRRRPSNKFVPKIVMSSSTETTTALSEVETHVNKLIEESKSTSLDSQRNACSELRFLARHSMENPIVMADCGAIVPLVNLLGSTDNKIQESAVTALLNLSIDDNNKSAIANAGAIELLMHVLETGTPEAKENSAATLFSISVVEDNKAKIGRAGVIKPLVDLLGNGTPRGKRDAATALFNLSILHENKTRILEAGAVKHLVALMDPAAGMVDKAVAVLSNLATTAEGKQAIGTEEGIPGLVEVVELGSARGKENAAAALLQLCTSSNLFCNVVIQEGAIPPLKALLHSGTSRAKEKVQTPMNS